MPRKDVYTYLVYARHSHVYGKLPYSLLKLLGANAVLLESTGSYKIWAGVPARFFGKRPAG